MVYERRLSGAKGSKWQSCGSTRAEMKSNLGFRQESVGLLIVVVGVAGEM
jgi:hypothetical protein